MISTHFKLNQIHVILSKSSRAVTRLKHSSLTCIVHHLQWIVKAV